MKDALDIYIKLLVATISFIAPLLIHLLSVFSDGIAVKKRRWDEYENQTQNAVKEAVTAQGVDIMKLAQKSSAEFQTRKVDNTRQLNLLDPKKQIKFIFPIFFLSIMLIIVSKLWSEEGCTKEVASWIDYLCYRGYQLLILGSVVFAGIGVARLYMVAIAIITVKAEIAAYNEEEKQQLKGNKITPTVNEKV